MTTSRVTLENTKRKSNAGRKPKPQLTIAIDCGSISAADHRERGGIATITSNLLLELARIDKRNHYLLYSFTSIDEEIVAAFGTRAKNHVSPIPQGYKSWWLKYFLGRDKPDVFLALSQAMPQTTVSTIGFIYDLGFMHYPHFYEDAPKLAENTQFLLKNAAQLITLSKATQRDVFEKFLIDTEKLTVVYPGVSPMYKPVGPKIIGPLPYFLYVGAFKKSKNIPFLIEAFAQFLEQNTKQYQLILIGNDKNQDPDISKTIAKLQLEKQVIIKGYVPTEDLPAYYRGAVAFVSPALYEGFGLPILEAMASGIAVIVGNNSSMPEIVGKAGMVVDVRKPMSLYQACMKIVNDALDARKRTKQGIKRAKGFMWNTFAKSILTEIERRC